MIETDPSDRTMSDDDLESIIRERYELRRQLSQQPGAFMTYLDSISDAEAEIIVPVLMAACRQRMLKACVGQLTRTLKPPEDEQT